MVAPECCWLPVCGGKAALGRDRAMMNGIPALITNRGGTPEMMQDGGIILNLSQDLHEAPYIDCLKRRIASSGRTLIRIYDDEAFMPIWWAKAVESGIHTVSTTNIQRLIQAITPLLDRRAGIRISRLAQASHSRDWGRQACSNQNINFMGIIMSTTSQSEIEQLPGRFMALNWFILLSRSTGGLNPQQAEIWIICSTITLIVASTTRTPRLLRKTLSPI